MSTLEKLSLYLIIFNAAYFVSVSPDDPLKTLSWFGMVICGIVFVSFRGKKC